MLRNPLLNKSKTFSKHLNEDILNLGNQTFIIPEDFSFNIITVSKEFIARPDLISQYIYGSDIYQDVLCKLNGISNPFELNEGDELIIPEEVDIHNFYYAYQDELDDIDENNDKLPKPKTKQQKRTANEAILGDDRFRIDSQKRVIIY